MSTEVPPRTAAGADRAPDKDRLINTCIGWREHPGQSNEALLADLDGFEINPGTLAEATARIGRLITAESRPPWRVQIGRRSAWEQRAKSVRFNVRQIMRQWVRYPDLMTLYVVHLYNLDFGKTRQMVDYLLAIKPPPPYLKALLFHAIQDVFALTQPEMASLKKRANWQARLGYLSRLLETEALKEWIESRPKHVRYYSGLTNTIVGFYDWILVSPESGFQRLPRDADLNLDLGGGYGTPDIARMSGLEMVSYDLNSPYDAEEAGIRFRTIDDQTGKSRFQTTDERDDYLQRLQQTRWQPFDVFRDHITREHESYVITSFGFLSSTVRSLSEHIPKLRGTKAKQFYATTYMGLWKILELVAAGKRVDVFTYQRALARYYRNRTVMLSFRDGQLVDSHITGDPRFDPSSPKFKRLKERSDLVSRHFKGLIRPVVSDYGQIDRDPAAGAPESGAVA